MFNKFVGVIYFDVEILYVYKINMLNLSNKLW